MSKILRLLKKARESKEKGYLTSQSSDHVILDPQKFINDDSDPSALNEMPFAEEGFMGFKMPSKQSILFSLSVIALLFVSFSALNQSKASQTSISSLMHNMRLQQEKIATLEAYVSTFKERDEGSFAQVNARMSQFKNILENNNIALSELISAQNLYKLKMDDMKVTDRLLLDKIISVNQHVKEIKKLQISDRREISYGKDN